MRITTGAVLMVLLAAGCGTAETENRPAARMAPPPTSSDYRVCEGRVGSVTDVAHEPDWRRYADYRPWATRDGCLLRIDVLGDRAGPEHCGFQSARVIVTGDPIGTRYSNTKDEAVYVRDPDNVFGDAVTAAAFDPNAELPEAAADTGFRHGGTALWVDPSDPSSIYLVAGLSVERWPRDPEPTLCA
jgi:hypothetical protein